MPGTQLLRCQNLAFDILAASYLKTKPPKAARPHTVRLHRSGPALSCVPEALEAELQGS